MRLPIYCMQCGKELPDDANVCLKCGMQVGGTIKSTPQPEPKWEYCQIVPSIKPSPKNNTRSFSDKMTGRWWHDIVFIAHSVGHQGVFDAAQGKDFRGRTYSSFNRNSNVENVPPLSNDLQDSAAVKKLIEYLTRQGWERLPNTGIYWYSYSFRRKVR